LFLGRKGNGYRVLGVGKNIIIKKAN
jgi:hypothetical protein